MSESQSPEEINAKSPKITKAQLTALRWARRQYSDDRVPPFVFRNYRSSEKLLQLGLIEWWKGFGAPMFRFTKKGLDLMQEIG